MHRRFLFFLFMMAGLQLSGCSSGGNGLQQEPVAKNVDADEFQKLMTEKNGIVVDVRTADEVSQGFIKGAVNYDFYGEEFAVSLGKLDRNSPVFVYCAIGGRSSKAMNQLTKLGFMEVYNLEGGFDSWASLGKPVATD